MSETQNLPYKEASAAVEDRALDFLLTHKDPARTTDLTALVDGGAISARVLREVLAHSSRFVSVNRKWDVAVRHTLGAATLDHAVDSILEAYGRPLGIRDLASELSVVGGQSEEYYRGVLRRFLRQRDSFVEVGDEEWARAEWILKLADTEEDILFENFFMSPEQDELDLLVPAAAAFKWDPSKLAGSALKFVEKQERSVSNRVLSYFAWRAAPVAFDPLAFFQELRSSPDALMLSGCRWCPASLRRQFEAVYEEIGQHEIEEPLPAEEIEAPREEKPISPLAAEDLEQVFRLIEGSGRTWRVPELVETAFDLTEGDRGYEESVQQLNMLMVDDERFLWVGTDRWREANSIPDYVLDVPEQLLIQKFIFLNENDEPIDFELDDKGIEESLLASMRDLLVQDFGDREESGEQEELNTFDLWLTQRHRETGTLPVLPAYRGLFPPAPDIIEVGVTVGAGQRFTVWLNDTLETMFGFGQWFIEADLPLSGATFTLSRTRTPGEYRLDYSGATEARLVVDDQRLDELEMLRFEAESEASLPTFDIIRKVMEHYGAKGTSFVRIWNEVNVVRRTTRRMIASLLSAYQCFVNVNKGSDTWMYDEKRLQLGVSKTKRKFIRAIE